MKTIYNYFIIDDEPAPREILAKHIARHPSLNLFESFDEAKKALNYLRRNKPDIIFLDIEMPDITGIQFVERLGIPGTHFIFVTAYPQYAHESYNLDVIAYKCCPRYGEYFRRQIF